MAFELYIAGNPPARFATEQEALEAAALALRQHPDTHVDVIDLATGRPALLGGHRDWRQHIRHHKHHTPAA